MVAIETERLRLLPLAQADLALLIHRTSELETRLDVTISRAMLGDPVPKAVATKLYRMQTADTTVHLWLTYWLLIERATNFAIGLTGFKGGPDAMGTVEIGYGIDGGHWGQGYATEAVRTLVAWALSRPDCRAVLAEVRHSNAASMRVLEKSGFVFERQTTGSQFYRATRDGRR